MWHYFDISVEVMLLCKFVPSGVLQTLLKTPSSRSLPQDALGEKTTAPKNTKGKIQELGNLCRLSLWSCQSRTFLATLLRWVSGTCSSHSNTLLLWVSSFHVVKDGYLGSWVQNRGMQEAGKRRPRTAFGCAWVGRCFYYIFTTLIAQPACICATRFTCGLLPSDGQRIARDNVSSQTEQYSRNPPPDRMWYGGKAREGTNHSNAVALGAAGWKGVTAKGVICSCHPPVSWPGAGPGEELPQSCSKGPTLVTG